MSENRNSGESSGGVHFNADSATMIGNSMAIGNNIRMEPISVDIPQALAALSMLRDQIVTPGQGLVERPVEIVNKLGEIERLVQTGASGVVAARELWSAISNTFGDPQGAALLAISALNNLLGVN